MSRPVASPRLRCRGWHPRRSIWAPLSDLRSPDGLGTGAQVQVGEVSPVALEAFLPDIKRAVLGEPKVDPLPQF